MRLITQTKAVLLAISLGLCGASQAAGIEDQTEIVELMNRYLELSDQVVDIASRREATIFLAVEGIFEVYEQRKDARGAVDHLERILADSNSQTVRNIVRMKLRDIHKETGELDKALAELDAIIKENSN